MLTVMLVACAMPAVANASQTGKSAAAGPITPVSPRSTYAITRDYAIRYYPRHQSWWIQNYVPTNRFTAAITGQAGLVNTQFRLVDAINVDTVYGASLSVDLTSGPVILTMPGYDHVSSLLTLNVFGDLFQTGIDPKVKGTYALVPPGWQGTLPEGVKEVQVPVTQSEWIIRADRYTHDGVNVIADAKAFVFRGVRLATLANYLNDPNSGRTIPVPLPALGPPTKTIADAEMTNAPTKYLRLTQEAMHSPTTGPLTDSDRALSADFDRVFAAAQADQEAGDNEGMDQIVRGVRNAHAMIRNNYFSHVIPGTQWINFSNAANAGTNYLDRASFQMFVLYGNGITTTRYYDAFTDHLGVPLDTGTFRFYRMTFPADQIPEATRFWSLTAYLTPALNLLPGPVNGNMGQGNVSSYTPNLQKNRDGSITIYIQPNRPRIASRRPNWLKVPEDGEFSLLFRVYGPTGNTAPDKTFVPPDIKPYGLL